MSFILLYQLKGNAKEPTILKIVTNVDPDDVVKFQGGLRQCLHRSPATGFTLAYPAKNGRVYVVSQAVGAHSKKQNKQLIDPQFCFKATRSFWFFFPSCLYSGKQFSTKDADNDALQSTHCAQSKKGAWWYSGCSLSNLNELYHNGGYIQGDIGMKWKTFRGHFYSLKRTEMKVKPKS